MAYDSIFVMSGAESCWEEAGAHHGKKERQYQRQYYEIDDERAGIRLRPSYSITQENYSPRHRHAFEQIRYVVGGHVYYGTKRYGAGSLAYFPESVHYGPTKSETEPYKEVDLRFPAPSGAPFFKSADIKRAFQEMQAQGAIFKGGVCHWPSGKKQDASEACWEHMAGQKIKYAPRRYDEPIFTHSQNFPGQSGERPGVSFKRIAYFNECGPNVILVRLEPGASTSRGVLGCYQVRFIVDGSVEYAGKICPTVSCLYYPPGVPYEEMVSRSGATVLVIQIKPPGGESPPLNVI